NPIIKCIQVEAAQEYSSLTNLVEHAPALFARRMQHYYNRCPAPNARAGIESLLHAVFAPAGIKLRTNSPISSTNLSEPDSFSICATIAEPTTAASAYVHVCATCAALEMPKPTATGKLENLRTRATSNSASRLRFSRVPVTPALDTAYTKPLACAVIMRKRSSVDVGATRKIMSRSLAFNAPANSSDSSGVKSVTRTPSIPASRAARASLSIPN